MIALLRGKCPKQKLDDFYVDLVSDGDASSAKKRSCNDAVLRAMYIFIRASSYYMQVHLPQS